MDPNCNAARPFIGITLINIIPTASNSIADNDCKKYIVDKFIIFHPYREEAERIFLIFILESVYY